MNHWQQQLLQELQQRGVLSDNQMKQLTSGAPIPWYMALLTALAAWLAAMLMVGAVLLLFDRTENAALAVCGILSVGLSLWLFRRRGLFASQLSLASSLIGQALLVFAAMAAAGWSADSWRVGTLTAGCLAAVLLLAHSTAIHRMMCALLVMVSGALLSVSEPWLGLYSIALATTAVSLWLLRSLWLTSDIAGMLRALAGAATLVALLSVLVVPGSGLNFFVNAKTQPWAWIYTVGAAVLLLATCAWLVRGARLILIFGSLAALLLAIVLFIHTPGFLVGAALWLAVFYAGDKFWTGVVGIAVTGYLGCLYWNLQLPLLDKSLVLLAGGLGLLWLRWLMLKRVTTL